MPRPGFKEIPPVSKVTPLPTSTTGACSSCAWYSRVTIRPGRSDPLLTARKAYMPKSAICCSFKTVTLSKSGNSAAKAKACSARYSGKQILPGRLPKSRAKD